MRPASTRRWPTLADLMILTGATGAAVALLRFYLAAIRRPDAMMSHVFRVQEGVYGCWSLVAAWWMMALLLIQARPPRVARPRLARRPGQVACVAAVVGLAVGGLRLTTFRVLGEEQPGLRVMTPVRLWIEVSNQVAPTILGAWLILALSGRWRADPGWGDRLGRILGFVWIAWYAHFLIPWEIRSRWYAALGSFSP